MLSVVPTPSVYAPGDIAGVIRAFNSVGPDENEEGVCAGFCSDRPDVGREVGMDDSTGAVDCATVGGRTGAGGVCVREWPGVSEDRGEEEVRGVVVVPHCCKAVAKARTLLKRAFGSLARVV